MFEHAPARFACAAVMVGLRILREELGAGGVEWEHALDPEARVTDCERLSPAAIRAAGDANVRTFRSRAMSAINIIVREDLEAFGGVERRHG